MPETGLPEWVELSDLDKGAVLLYLRRLDLDGFFYASTEHPARYFDHPVLTGLEAYEASSFAADANDCAGMHPFKEEAAAREELRRTLLWINSSFLARRTVITTRWEKADDDDA